jgi:RimJ/RimL family protein N-acetyltransferase
MAITVVAPPSIASPVRIPGHLTPSTPGDSWVVCYQRTDRSGAVNTVMRTSLRTTEQAQRAVANALVGDVVLWILPAEFHERVGSRLTCANLADRVTMVLLNDSTTIHNVLMDSLPNLPAAQIIDLIAATGTSALEPNTLIQTLARDDSGAAKSPVLKLRLLDDRLDLDRAFILALLSSEPWQRNIAIMSHVTDGESAGKYIRDRPHAMFADAGVGVCALCIPREDLADGEVWAPVGVAGLVKRDEFGGVLDIGFALLPEAMGRGLAVTASALFAEFACFLLGEKEIAAVTRKSNEAALRVLQAVGFPPTPTWEAEAWGCAQCFYRVPLDEMASRVRRF